MGDEMAYRAVSSDTTAIRPTPSPRNCSSIRSTDSTPSIGCPPVIATASLYRILNVIEVPAETAYRIASRPEWMPVI
tara:strand:+ start:667 stop:897 length:231 start_codon:yes stop_codon:yes gene_type:complete